MNCALARTLADAVWSGIHLVASVSALFSFDIEDLAEDPLLTEEYTEVRWE